MKVFLFEEREHRDEVIALWNDVFGYEAPHNAPELVITKKVAAADGLFFVATSETNTVIATILAGYDGHRGWVYSLAVAETFRRQGIATALVKHAEDALAQRGCLKINLQIVESNAAVKGFYESLGYTTEKRISMGKVL